MNRYHVFETKIPDVCEYLIYQLNILKNVGYKHSNLLKSNVLSSNSFDTENLLECDFSDRDRFLKVLDCLKWECESECGKTFNYNFAHMIDYEGGGSMNIHNHAHNEDYNFILYLNNCRGGETVLYENDKKTKFSSIKPRKGRMLILRSDLYHSSNLSSNKKVFVGGLNIRNQFNT